MSVEDLVSRHGGPDMRLELKISQLWDELAKWATAEFGAPPSDKWRDEKRAFIRQMVEELVRDSVILESIHFMKLTNDNGQIKMRFGGDMIRAKREDIPEGYGIHS